VGSAGLARLDVAGPEAIAAPREREHRAGAAGALAGDPRNVLFTGARAVTETVGPAGRGPLIGAVVPWIGRHVGGDAAADVPGRCAGLAGSGAGALAADSVGAEGRRAVGSGVASLPDLGGRRGRTIDPSARIGSGLDAPHVLLDPTPI